MGENILRSELIYPYHVNNYSNYNGEWTTRNGENAIVVAPTRFYANSTYSHIFTNEFVPNTRYLFNLYLDTDDHYHNNVYTGAGFAIGYSDGTTEYGIRNGQSSAARGWVQHRFITPANKSVAYIWLTYNYGEPSYYRWDSIIVPYENFKITKKGQALSSILLEDGTKTSMINGGLVETDNLYEF